MDKFYYISQGKSPEEHIANIQTVCEAGIELVQLRMKEISEQDFLNTAKQAKEICQAHGSKLIINDNIEVAKAVAAYGIHLGKEDRSPLKAREVLGNQVIIGGTANTLEDCQKLIKHKVDYIGLGPFRFTETKKKLSPILGIEGYQNIIKTLRNQGHSIPIYAIGGIALADFDEIFEAGVYGIAVSSLFSNISTAALKNMINESITNSR